MDIEYKRKGREKEYYKEWYTKNKNNKIRKTKEWYQKTREIRLKKRKERYYENPKKEIEKVHNWQKQNREKYNAWARQWAKKHRQKINQDVANKKKNDSLFKLKNDIRKRTSIALKRNYQKGSGLKYLGCTIPELKTHLEKQFQKGMTWKNHSIKGWHIDHIIEINKFDLTKEDEIKKAFHYTNLQPLWAYDNLRKK